jgi:hypothetical protein
MARQTTPQHAWRTEQTGGHVGRTSFSQVEKSMQSHSAKIVRADERDADAIIAILSTGFQNDPVSRWLFPDDDARERLHPEFFGPIVQMALEDGEIYTTEDRSGTALWLPVTAHHEDQPGSVNFMSRSSEQITPNGSRLSTSVPPPIIQTARTISTCPLSPSGHSFSTRASERPCSAIAWLH